MRRFIPQDAARCTGETVTDRQPCAHRLACLRFTQFEEDRLAGPVDDDRRRYVSAESSAGCSNVLWVTAPWPCPVEVLVKERRARETH